MTIQTAGISEIFSSLQGEGPFLGERHLFIRFERCNIHCGYCDELEKPGTLFDIPAILKTVHALEQEQGPHRFISLTGGEPLYYHSFLKSLCPELKREGFRLYLETNGILWKPLETLIDFFDVIAMDMKPASVTNEKNYFEEHERFLAIAKRRRVFIKIVISQELEMQEFLELCKIIQVVAPEMILVLQPISGENDEGHDNPKLMHLLGELQKIAGAMGLNVRIIPRLHKILKIR